METQSHIPILKRLFVSYVIDDKYTIEELVNTQETKIQPSDFFKNFRIDKLDSIDSLTAIFNTIFNDKDSPSFQLEYKISNFYSLLTPQERRILHDFYVKCCSFYDAKLGFTFQADESKIPQDLYKFIYYNSVNFFDEFDFSDGIIDVEYLLDVIDNYSSNFKFDLNHLFNNLSFA